MVDADWCWCLRGAGPVHLHLYDTAVKATVEVSASMRAGFVLLTDHFKYFTAALCPTPDTERHRSQLMENKRDKENLTLFPEQEVLRIKAARLSLNPKEQKRKAAQTLGAAVVLLQAWRRANRGTKGGMERRRMGGGGGGGGESGERREEKRSRWWRRSDGVIYE